MSEKVRTLDEIDFSLPLSEAAILTGFSRKTLNEWRKNGMPVQGRPFKVRVSDLFRWREAVSNDAMEDLRESMKEVEGDDFDRRFRKARAEKIEIENARTRGELLSVETVKDFIAEMDSMTVKAIRNLEKSLPPILASIADERTIAKEIRESVETTIEDRGKMQAEWMSEVKKQAAESKRITGGDNGSVD